VAVYGYRENFVLEEQTIVNFVYDRQERR